MKLLRRTLFGNPILRQKSRQLNKSEILSPEIAELIKSMQYTLERRKFGIGLAAPQIGEGIALSVIGIKPTPNRPDNPHVDMVIINPEIVRTYGKQMGLWEGCISLGTGADSPYAQAMRYKKVRVRYYDEKAKLHEKDFDGLLAHVMQHEIDHLKGILFVDRVEDSKTFVTQSEYRKRYLKKP